VTHYSRLFKVVIDVSPDSHDKEVEFWQGALGRPLTGNSRFPEYHGTMLHTDAFRLLTQKLGEGPSRVHLDIHTDDLAAEVARLEGLGAHRVREVNGWWLMQDPAGLPFCVLQDPPGRLNEDNAQRWD
jgi:hypothetical protein